VATSGAPETSAKGDVEQFMIGDEIDVQAATAFRIAPRIYVLSQAPASGQSSPGKCDSSGAIADLPLHLVFRESAPGDRLRQCWVSDGDANWRWLLAVEQQGESVVATLTAEAPPTAGGNGRLAWRANGAWDPFGQNTLNPESAGTAAGTLIVRAP
jgi:hypothetical protein